MSDAALELSIERLVSMLNEKLFMECGRVQSAMPPMSRVQMVTMTAEVDALEKRARDVIHEVISLRNALQPVNRLPPEVLTSCAAFVSDTDPRPIVSLTHVCRYWRRSITSNPSSWASIASGWKRLAPVCLERAGTVPLAVDISVPDIKGDSCFLQELLPHVARVSHLSLTGHSSIDAVTDDLPGLFASPMPNLTTLELHQTAEPTELFPPRTTPVPLVFQNVSNLKSLRLTRTPLYSTLFGIASLKDLKLTGYPFHFGTFIRFLASNPNLEIVDLDVKFIEGSIWTLPPQIVTLARLQRLSITCAKSADAMALLSRVSLPHGICLEVFCSQSTTLGLCLPSPPTHIQRVLAPITTIRFQVTPGEIHISGRGGFLSFRCLQPQVWWNINPELHLFPTTSVREFHVNIAPWVLTPDFLGPLFAQLPALETLVIAAATSWATGAFDSLAGQPPLCPSLKTIAFFNCGFTTQGMEGFESVIAKRKGSAATWLYRVVIVSKTTRALPDSTLIQQLRQHVPCVNVAVDDKLPDLS